MGEFVLGVFREERWLWNVMNMWWEWECEKMGMEWVNEGRWVFG